MQVQFGNAPATGMVIRERDNGLGGEKQSYYIVKNDQGKALGVPVTEFEVDANGGFSQPIPLGWGKNNFDVVG